MLFLDPDKVKLCDDQIRRAVERARNYPDNHTGEVALVAGDVSGIQDYLAEAAARGMDGAGRRLRFRSFLVRVLARVATFQLLDAAGSLASLDPVLVDSGGLFLLLLPASVL